MIRRTDFVFFLVMFLGVTTVQAQEAQNVSSASAIASLYEDDFVNAWHAADAVAITDLWTDDGDWSSIVGSRRVVAGKSNLKGVWEIGLQGRDSAELRNLRVDITNIRMLKNGLGLVDLVMHFAEGSPSAMREEFVMVVQRVEEEWKIVSARAARLSD